MAVSEADDLHDTAGAVVMTGARRTPSVTVMADATDASDAAVFVVETVAPAPARHDSSEAAADRKRRQSELGESQDPSFHLSAPSPQGRFSPKTFFQSKIQLLHSSRLGVSQVPPSTDGVCC